MPIALVPPTSHPPLDVQSSSLTSVESFHDLGSVSAALFVPGSRIPGSGYHPSRSGPLLLSPVSQDFLSLQRCFNIRSLFIVIKVFGLMEGAKRYR